MRRESESRKNVAAPLDVVEAENVLGEGGVTENEAER
jgi:hypothetical protein